MVVRLLAAVAAVLCLLVPAAAAADPPGSAGGGSPGAATGVRAGSQAWGWPLAGPPPVTRPFDPLPHPYTAGHRGVDLAGSPGAPVLAAGDGVVAFAGAVAGRPVVSIEHAGGLRTTYEPVEPSVAAGLPVVRGSPIGVLVAGHAGCPVEACLHWGLRRGATYLDPLGLVDPARVRLLPPSRRGG